MKRTLFTVLLVILTVLLTVTLVELANIRYLDNKRLAAPKAVTTTTTVPSTTTTVPSTTTTTAYQWWASSSTTMPPVEGGTTTTTIATPAKASDDCDNLSLLDYWRTVAVEDINAFIAKIPETRTWILACGSKRPIEVGEIRRWIEVRLSL